MGGDGVRLGAYPTGPRRRCLSALSLNPSVSQERVVPMTFSALGRRALAWLPLQLVTLLRRVQLRGRPAVHLALGSDRVPTSLEEARQIHLIRALANDPEVRAVVLDLRDLQRGWASLQDLREAISTLRQSGTLVVAHLDTLTTREVYLASVVDRLWLTPVGEVFLQGIAAHLNFYGDALAAAGVVVDLEAAGTYKSFGEPYTRGFPTRANREQTLAVVSGLQEQVFSALAEARGLERAELDALAASSPLSASAAKDAGLVDALLYPDEAESAVEALVGEKLRTVSAARYGRLFRWVRFLAKQGQTEGRVAVVHLEGSIVESDKNQPSASIASQRVVPVLDALREDGRVHAVVLAVNSPGGSALASDLIARAVQQLVDEKPVVAAFGNVSASGGYYLSAPAVEVVARPGTLTGSIGVVGGKVAIGPALEQVGVHQERVGTAPESGLFHPWHPLTPKQRIRFRAMLARTYARFLQVVASGRRLPLEAVEAVAEGRVWTGAQAKEIGLVDHIGDLEVAVCRAGRLADLARPQLQTVHIRFAPSRTRRLRALLGAQVAGRPWVSDDWVDRGLAALGPTSRLARLVRQHPLQPLLLLPYEVDLD